MHEGGCHTWFQIGCTPPIPCLSLPPHDHTYSMDVSVQAGAYSQRVVNQVHDPVFDEICDPGKRGLRWMLNADCEIIIASDTLENLCDIELPQALFLCTQEISAYLEVGAYFPPGLNILLGNRHNSHLGSLELYVMQSAAYLYRPLQVG